MTNNSKIYSTKELVEILKQEMMACVNGERTFPMPENAEDIAKQTPLGGFLGAQRMFEIGCYHEFRDQVQKYQIENNVSGLEIESYTIGHKIYRFPAPVHQLELTKNDYQVLALAKDLIVDAFVGFYDSNTYLSFSHEDKSGCTFDIETTIRYVKHFADCCDWAEITTAKSHEVVLLLGYGDYHQSVFVASMSEKAKYSDSVYFSCAKLCDIN